MFLCMERIDGLPRRVNWWRSYADEDLDQEVIYKYEFFDKCRDVFGLGLERLLTRQHREGKGLSMFYTSQEQDFSAGVESMLDMLRHYADKGNHFWMCWLSAEPVGRASDVKLADIIMAVTLTLMPDCALVMHMGISRSFSFGLRQLRAKPEDRHPSADYPVPLSVLLHCYAARTILSQYGAPRYLFTVPVPTMTSILRKSFEPLLGKSAWFHDGKVQARDRLKYVEGGLNAVPEVRRWTIKHARGEFVTADDMRLYESSLSKAKKDAKPATLKMWDDSAEDAWRKDLSAAPDFLYFSLHKPRVVLVRDPRRPDVLLYESRSDREVKVNGRPVEKVGAYKFLSNLDIEPEHGVTVLIDYEAMASAIERHLA